MPRDHEAMLWEKLDGQNVRCNLCGHRCVLSGGQFGLCRVRANVEGLLRTYSYGTLVAMNADPIEKKPLFHFLPGSRSLSVAAAGCNFQCEFCQNWQISQSPRRSGAVTGQAVSPHQVVTAARSYDCRSISYTYTQPTIFFEMACETARLAHAEGIRNCFVSNGFMTELAVETISPVLDAINVDLKAFRDETYRSVMKARLVPVLRSMKALTQAGVWLEVTTLVVPGMNDSPQELGEMASWIASELGTHVPWHVSRFHGDYNMTDRPPTPMATLETALSLGREAGLKYVYCGNVIGRSEESTRCPACGLLVIERVGFSVRSSHLRQGACGHCGEPIEGVWE